MRHADICRQNVQQAARRRRVSDGGRNYFNRLCREQITIGTRDDETTKSGEARRL